MHFYNILTVGQFSRKLSQLIQGLGHTTVSGPVVIKLGIGNNQWGRVREGDVPPKRGSSAAQFNLFFSVNACS